MELVGSVSHDLQSKEDSKGVAFDQFTAHCLEIGLHYGFKMAEVGDARDDSFFNFVRLCFETIDQMTSN